ncbi:MAG: hypothetical protein FWF28_00825 [Micrococcales bacterium]|nr:hypothetical protein [Micrococcales bacterium]
MSVERTVKFATTVDDLPAAWAFVMDHMDDLGPDPQITISPVWQANDSPPLDSDFAMVRRFEVAASGTVTA